MSRSLLFLLLLPAIADAGLYYSGETIADLPSRWPGFLLDHRALLLIAQPKPASPLRLRYESEAARLARKGSLSADEAADLGALYLRLGEASKAVAVLRPAQRANPLHFRLAANLGTAWQQAGDLTQAAAALEQAVRLAPGKDQRAA
jgi:tetratricopeptide (TPR) repeat protein